MLKEALCWGLVSVVFRLQYSCKAVFIFKYKIDLTGCFIMAKKNQKKSKEKECTPLTIIGQILTARRNRIERFSECIALFMEDSLEHLGKFEKPQKAEKEKEALLTLKDVEAFRLFFERNGSIQWSRERISALIEILNNPKSPGEDRHDKPKEVLDRISAQMVGRIEYGENVVMNKFSTYCYILGWNLASFFNDSTSNPVELEESTQEVGVEHDE